MVNIKYFSKISILKFFLMLYASLFTYQFKITLIWFNCINKCMFLSIRIIYMKMYRSLIITAT